MCQVDDRRDFFANRSGPITKRHLPLKSPELAHLDLRNDVSDRIYEIRCRIVHTKSNSGDADIEPLLPFSREAEALTFEIDLVQFIAREVIIAAGTPSTFESLDLGTPDAEEPG